MTSPLLDEEILRRSHLRHDELVERLGDDHRVELVDGEPWTQPVPPLSHQRTARRLFLALHEAAHGRGEVFFAPTDVLLAGDTMLQPDLFLVLDEHRGRLRRVVEGPPDLCVEVVSPSTAARDRGVKRQTYARFGVAEYWLVDPERRTVTVERRPGGRGYAESEVLAGDRRLRTPLLPGLDLAVEEVFAPEATGD